MRNGGENPSDRTDRPPSQMGVKDGWEAALRLSYAIEVHQHKSPGRSPMAGTQDPPAPSVPLTMLGYNWNQIIPRSIEHKGYLQAAER